MSKNLKQNGLTKQPTYFVIGSKSTVGRTPALLKLGAFKSFSLPDVLCRHCGCGVGMAGFAGFATNANLMVLITKQKHRMGEKSKNRTGK